MFDLGIQELIVIFVVALIVFGPKRLPELGRTIGKGMAELRRAMEGVRAQMHAEMEPSVKPPAPEPTGAPEQKGLDTRNVAEPETAQKDPYKVKEGAGNDR